jgi:hypothetical protein
LVTIEIPRSHCCAVIDGGHRIAVIHLLMDIGLLTGNFSILSFPPSASKMCPTTGPNDFRLCIGFARNMDYD